MVWQANHLFPLEVTLSEVLCGFGCGRAAVALLKSGKAVCAISANQCPVMRQRNRAGKAGKNPFADRPHPRGMAGKPAWNRGLTWEQMFGEAEAERMCGVGRANIKKAQERLRSSPETENARRKKLSTIARRRGLGQYRQ